MSKTGTPQGMEIRAFEIPTDLPESDGTLAWNSTTLVTVHIFAEGKAGFGYTYAPQAAATVAEGQLASIVMQHDCFDIEACWQSMFRAVRNAGSPGIAACAISAVDIALWDLKAKRLQLPLVSLLGQVRTSIPIYGSGGFCSYDDQQLTRQFSAWREQGISRMKMKVGRDPSDDCRRVRVARAAIGDESELFVDANGAYDRKQALEMANRFHEHANVTWFEEPLSSDDLAGLPLMRDRGPAGMEIAAGEYGYTINYFRQMLEAGSVDCLQADVTRCGGITGFLKTAHLCEAFHLPLSGHCAPQLHASLGCSIPVMKHVEYFHDHVRIADLLFDSAAQAKDGKISPDKHRPGIGIMLKMTDAQPYQIFYTHKSHPPTSDDST